MCRNQTGATDEQKYLFAASLDGNTQYVCAGRCDHEDVRGLTPQDTLEQASRSTDDSSHYKWARYYRDGDTVNPSRPGLVYGESCVGKLHFDCAGFVRFCYSAVLNVPVGAMRARTYPIWHKSGNDDTLANVDIQPGDILYGTGHVGLATGRTEYGAQMPNAAIHAYYARAGVVATPITSRSNWTELRRWRDWNQFLLTGAPSAMA
jgi:cell wall-associated NlpC family hydrolase